jgi:predicted MPP superfamily phosphohydrolase
MLIGVLHISDIHLRPADSSILDRASHIVNAFSSRLSGTASALIAVSGDLAFSGKPTEYEVAERLLSALKEGIANRQKTDPATIPIVMVPGNHDCDFDEERDLRQRLLDSTDQSGWQKIGDTSIVEELTSIQKSYFELMQRLTPKRQSKHPHTQIAWTFELTLNTSIVLCRGYNTAWMSRKHERQGQLSFPVDAVPPDDTNGSVVISLFHHPYNWQEASQARAYRQRIEDTSDIVLTGHEHEAEVRTHSDARRELTHYVEGDVLQDNTSSRSGFNVILIDLTSQSWQVITFAWNSREELFTPDSESSWNPLGRSKRARRNFLNTEEFAAILSDPGANFTHPRARKLSLKDLFVYPDIDVSRPAKNEVTELISGAKLAEFVLKEQRCFLVGPAESERPRWPRPYTALYKMRARYPCYCRVRA